jgi:dTDP-4-dehydrorhamnose reductase
VKTMVNLGKKMNRLKVVADQFGSPTYTVDLSVLLVDMIQTDKYGVYHATSEGICSWYEFAQEIFRLTGLEVEVVPASSSEFPTLAKRPLNSRMAKDKLTMNGFSKLPPWQDALKRFLESLP